MSLSKLKSVIVSFRDIICSRGQKCKKKLLEHSMPQQPRLSKKWPCRFFEKASLRSAPLLSADSGQFNAHSAQSVFRHAHVAAENESYCFRVCGRETLRGFFTDCDARKTGRLEERYEEKYSYIFARGAYAAASQPLSSSAQLIPSSSSPSVSGTLSKPSISPVAQLT